jgi:hypothetical protein
MPRTCADVAVSTCTNRRFVERTTLCFVVSRLDSFPIAGLLPFAFSFAISDGFDLPRFAQSFPPAARTQRLVRLAAADQLQGRV